MIVIWSSFSSCRVFVLSWQVGDSSQRIQISAGLKSSGEEDDCKIVVVNPKSDTVQNSVQRFQASIGFNYNKAIEKEKRAI